MILDVSKYRFLVVDDELHIRKIIKAVCSSMGVKEIVEAQDGRTALDWLRTGKVADNKRASARPFDLVICDWMMPEMTGIELLRAVRTNKKIEKLPFLMLTAESDRNKVMAAIEEGVNDYLIKPFTAEMLESKIQSVLSKKK